MRQATTPRQSSPQTAPQRRFPQPSTPAARRQAHGKPAHGDIKPISNQPIAKLAKELNLSPDHQTRPAQANFTLTNPRKA